MLGLTEQLSKLELTEQLNNTEYENESESESNPPLPPLNTPSGCCT